MKVNDQFKLNLAAESGNYKQVSELLEKTDPRINGYYVVRMAIRKNHFQVLRVLMQDSRLVKNRVEELVKQHGSNRIIELFLKEFSKCD